uniref:Antigenic membrane protein Amp n=2 Tax=16SrI (Aster yellows group) TaxID=3042590 RepID=Q1MWA9_9MOLU|nr:antigenic membrane protein Amp [Sumac witches'-broom phytoplasma]BAN57419.1 antigenic membrane protein Amp [Rhus yellows phytoplasma]
MQNQKTQKSLVAKVLVLFAAVALMFVGVQVFADGPLDLSTLKCDTPLELTANDASDAEKVVTQWKVQNTSLDKKVTKDSVKVQVINNQVKVTPVDASTTSALKGEKLLDLVGVCELNKLTLGTDKKLTLTVKDDKVDAKAGLKALREAGAKVPATVTENDLTFTVGKGDDANKVTVKAVDGKTTVSGQVTFEFNVVQKPWYKTVWFLTLVAVVVVSAVAGGVFFFVKKNKKNK